MLKKKIDIKKIEEEKEECLIKLKLSEEKIIHLEDAIKEIKNSYQKAIEEWQSTYQILKRESLRQKTLALEQFVRDLIPVIDSLEEALKLNQHDYSKIYEGVTMMSKNVQQILEKHGVTAFGEVGDTFNPEMHEALNIVFEEGIEPNSIIKIYRKGYLLSNTILKPALVSVVGYFENKNNKEDNNNA